MKTIASRARRGPRARLASTVAAALGSAALVVASARAEDLSTAWNIALTVNRGLQAQQESSVAAGFNVKAAESARYVTVRSYNINTALTNSPTTKAAPVNGSGSTTGTGTGTTGTGTAAGGGGAAAALGANYRVFTLGPNQTFLPISLTYASFPLYTGGRLLKTVEAAQNQLNAQRSAETQTAIDLKLTVAEAYVGVLRARRNLETARSNVEQLASFARDTRNRLNQQLAIRSDLLAAEVSLSNAQLSEITSRTGVETAYATYNRYLCRPLDAYAQLDEISEYPTDVNWEEAAAQAVRNRGEFAGMNDAEARELTAMAISTRPELINLDEQARSLAAQAQATKATLRPQVEINGGFVFLGAENFGAQGNGFLTGILDWTFTDSGRTRRQAKLVSRRRRARPRSSGPTSPPTSRCRSGPAGSTSRRRGRGSRSPGSPSSKRRRTSRSLPTATANSSRRTPRSSMPRIAPRPVTQRVLQRGLRREPRLSSA